MYISLWENYRGHPDNISFMQFSTKIDGFEQKDSQGFENSYNSYEQYPLEKFLIFTIYQNYTLALKPNNHNNNVPFSYSTYQIQMASLCARGIITPALALMQPFSAKSIRRNKFLLGTHLLHLGRERQ